MLNEAHARIRTLCLAWPYVPRKWLKPVVAYRFATTSCYTTYFKHNNEDATYQEKFVDVNFSILVDVNFTENLMKLVLGYFLSSFLSNI